MRDGRGWHEERRKHAVAAREGWRHRARVICARCGLPISSADRAQFQNAPYHKWCRPRVVYSPRPSHNLVPKAMTVAKQALPYVPYLVPAAAPWVMPGLALLNGLERANRPGASGDPIAEFARGAMEEFARSTIAGPFIDTAASSISHNSANFR